MIVLCRSIGIVEQNRKITNFGDLCYRILKKGGFNILLKPVALKTSQMRCDHKIIAIFNLKITSKNSETAAKNQEL